MADAAKPPKGLMAEEWDPNKPMVPPTDTMIIRPYRELMTFYPEAQPNREDLQWLQPIEERFLGPFGQQVARIFGVDLIDDLEYLSMPDEARASYLSCVLTRSGVRETQTGFVEWDPLVVVVKHCLYVTIHAKAERATGRMEIQRMLVWSDDKKEYAPVVDPMSTRIRNPGVLLQILYKYKRMEKGLG